MSLKSLKNQTLRNKSTINSVNLTGGASTGPVITSIIVTDSNYNNLDDTALLPAGGYAKLIGSGFASGCSAYFNGSAVTTTFVSSTEVRVVIPATSVGTYNVMLFNPSTAGAIYLNLGISNAPTFTTSAGSLGTSYETTAISTSIAATGDTPITYALYSGSLPSGVTLSSNGTLSGTSPVEASSTTYSFVVQATDAQLQDTTRSFSLTISTDVVTWSTPAADYAYTLTGNEAMSNVTLSAASAAGYNITYAANTLPTGVSLSGNTVYGTPTVEQTVYTALTATAATTGRSATRYVSWSVLLGDTYWKYTTLLLPGASTTFVDDASTNNFAVTINGDTKPNGFNPYTPGYYSNYFDGTGDYLSLTGQNLSSVNFTVECWVNFSSFSTTSGHLFNFGTNEPNRYGVYRDPVTGTLAIATVVSGSYNVTTSTTVLRAGTWYHVALVRNGSTSTLYVNGVNESTNTGSINSGTNWVIGFMQFGSAANDYVTGYISNFRVLNGTALYTANFTPPTAPLTAIANTSLLTCQANRIIDSSTNNFTLTVNGNTTVSSFDPFIPNSSYSTYGSGYFDGSGDYLNVASNNAFVFGTSNFTLEAWAYLTAAPATYPATIISNGGDSNTTTNVSFIVDITTALLPRLYIGTSTTSSVSISSSTAITVGTWNHIAVTRSSNTFTLWLNGVSVATTTSSVNISALLDVMISKQYTDLNNRYLTGYMSDVRVVKGTAVYTTSFTPPSTPLTAIANTSLLTLQNNQPVNNHTFLDNSSNNFLITKPGASNSSQGTFSPYGGNWSNYFDGTGDYLTTASNSNLAFGTGNFTVEFWFNAQGAGDHAQQHIFQTRDGTNNGLLFQYDRTNKKLSVVSDTGLTGLTTANDAISDGVWYHAALTRSGTTIYFFVNGVQIATTTSAQNFNSTTPYLSRRYATDGFLHYFNGYISNLRMITGTAVYTAAFTPPTTPLTAIANTSLLTCQSNRLIDNSINNLTITKNGDVSVQRYNPFNPSSVTSTSYSAYFDGSGDWLSSSAWTSAGQFGTGDFTVECWVYATGAPNSNQVIWGCNSYPNTTGLFLAYYGGSSNNLGLRTGATNLIDSSAGWAFNTWLHVAVVRASGTLTLYINGTSRGSTTFTNNCTDGLQYIGRPSDIGNYTMQGYISNFRIVKGTAIYTSSFTPSTTPITAISNTSLLTCQSTTFIDNSTNNFTITASGNSQPSIQNPFGYTSALTNGYTTSTIGGSAYFDGTGDYLTLAANSLLTITAGPSFTMEAWIYPVTNTEGYPIIVSQDDGGTNNQCFQFRIVTSNNTLSFVYFTTSARSSAVGVATTNSVILNQWNHVAVSWTGTTLYLFINGVIGFSGAVSTIYGGQNNPTWIGVLSSSNTTAFFKGYISDVRMIRGQALYTSNFVPPAQPLTAVRNTTLLTNMASAGIYDASTMNVMETAGDAKLSTAVTKFGGSSMYFDGSGDGLLIPYTPQHHLPADFTIEFWVYWNGAAGTHMLINKGGGINIGWASYEIYIDGTSGNARYAGSSTNTGYDLGGESATGNMGVVSANTWTHIALTRSGTSFRGFVNGVQGFSQTSSVVPYDTSPRGLLIGSSFANTWGSTPTGTFVGYIDDLRITKGYARYTSNFTAPTSAFQIK